MGSFQGRSFSLYPIPPCSQQALSMSLYISYSCSNSKPERMHAHRTLCEWQVCCKCAPFVRTHTAPHFDFAHGVGHPSGRACHAQHKAPQTAAPPSCGCGTCGVVGGCKACRAVGRVGLVGLVDLWGCETVCCRAAELWGCGAAGTSLFPNIFLCTPFQGGECQTPRGVDDNVPHNKPRHPPQLST